MHRFLAWALAMSAATAAVAQAPAPRPAQDEVPTLTAAEIIARNAAARGGSDAWQKTQTMVWAGHTESSKTPGQKLPFLLELKRPGRTRFEIATGAGKSLRIYDGTNGWKLHPDSSGLPEVQPYTADELASARRAQVIDGPLMDYAAKGGAIALAGIEALEGRKAYVLKARLPSGDGGRLWVDAESFLEVRFDREVPTAAGRTATTTIFYRDYRAFQGLKIPVIIETGSGAGRTSNKLVIEKVALNPPIDDQAFAKPLVAARRHGVVVDTRSAAAPAGPSRPAPRQP